MSEAELEAELQEGVATSTALGGAQKPKQQEGERDPGDEFEPGESISI